MKNTLHLATRVQEKNFGKFPRMQIFGETKSFSKYRITPYCCAGVIELETEEQVSLNKVIVRNVLGEIMGIHSVKPKV